MSDFRSFARATALAAAAALVAASVVPASAAMTDPKVGQDEGAKPEAKKARKYCVASDTTGTRIAKKVCKTRAEWIADDGFDPAPKDK